MVHHLQQDVVDVGVRLLDLVEQQHRVGLLGHRLGEQAALVEADVAGRRTDQARHRVPFHVLRHVEADQLVAERVGELACDLGLADAGRAREEEAADRLVRVAEAGARHLDRTGQRVDRRVLAEDDRLQVAVEVLQRAAVVGRHVRRGDARDAGDDLLDVLLADHLLLLRLGQDALRRAGFVDHVDGLVGQVPVGDEARRQFDRRGDCRRRVLDAVVGLEAGLQPLQDFDGFGDRRLADVDLLETPRQRVVLFEHAAVFRVGRRADALDLAVGEGGLQQVRRVERPTRRRAGADQRVDLVDEQDRVRRLGELLDDGLQALFEITAVLGAGEQRAHVEREDAGVGQHLGDLALDDAARQPFGDRGLADTGLADQQRVVLAPPAQGLDDALELAVAADQRIDAALLRQRVEVHRVLFERAAAGCALGLAFFLALALLARRLRLHLADAVGDEIDHVEPRHLLFLQEVDRVRILLAEDGDEDVGAIDRLLSRRLDVQDRALDDSLETERRLRVDLAVTFDGRRMVDDEGVEVGAHLVDVGAAGAQGLRRRRVVEQREQQVLDGDELVSLLSCLDKSHVQADFQFLGNHSVLLHDASQRMLVGAGKGADLFDLGRCDILRIDPAHAASFVMDFEHDSSRLFAVFCEKFHQDEDDEVHRREVVVEQQHLVEGRRRQTGTLGGELGRIMLMLFDHARILAALRESATARCGAEAHARGRRGEKIGIFQKMLDACHRNGVQSQSCSGLERVFGFLFPDAARGVVEAKTCESGDARVQSFFKEVAIWQLVLSSGSTTPRVSVSSRRMMGAKTCSRTSPRSP